MHGTRYRSELPHSLRVRGHQNGRAFLFAPALVFSFSHTFLITSTLAYAFCREAINNPLTSLAIQRESLFYISHVDKRLLFDSNFGFQSHARKTLHLPIIEIKDYPYKISITRLILSIYKSCYN